MSRLAKMMELQRDFDRVVEQRLGRQVEPHEVLQALSVEVAEATQETAFKWWKAGVTTNCENALEEGADALHFLLSFFLKIGASADDVFEAYIAKNKINHERLLGRVSDGEA